MAEDFRDYHTTPINSIRAFCITCMGYQIQQVSRCTATNCPLYPYRAGKRPKTGESQAVGLIIALNLSKRQIANPSKDKLTKSLLALPGTGDKPSTTPASQETSPQKEVQK